MDLKGNAVTWLGHGTWLWETASGQRILIDPFLENSPTCPEEHKQISGLDTILVTHGHIDHVADLVAAAVRSPDATIVASWDLGAHVIEQLSGVGKQLAKEIGGSDEGPDPAKVVQIGIGGTVAVPGADVTMVQAVHSSGIGPPDATMAYGGEASGFIVRLPGDLTVYHSGDTDVFGDMALIAELDPIDVAVLSIGDHFTMGAKRAAHAVKLLGSPPLVLGGHWGSFPVLHGTPAQLRELVPSGIDVPDLEPGTRFS